MKIAPVSFQNNLGLRLRGFVHEPKKYDTAIVFLHGFPGSMYGTAARALNAACSLGFLGLRFEFSGTNTSEGKFEDKLMSQEARDIKYAIDFLEKNYLFKKLVLVGISTGAIDAALYAYKDKRINKLILLSGVADLRRGVNYDFSASQVHDFWTKGYTLVNRPAKWEQRIRIKKAFYDEFFRLDIAKALKKYRRPILIVHGSADDAVPVQEAHELYRLAHQPKKLVIIKGADHRFRVRKHLKRLLREVYRFIR